MDISPNALVRLIDHTLLKPAATDEDLAQLVADARELGVWSVCVSPSMLPLNLDLGEVKLATVCGFPSGKHSPAVKAAEAAEAVANGADEVDMVIDIGRLVSADVAYTEAEIRAVRAMTSGAQLKVIIESAALTDEQIVAACRAAEAAGADYVKTSTGFHPSGGASAHAVQLMANTVGDRLGVKASGGIRTWADAIAMVQAGATRLGVSGTRAILDGAPSA